MANARRRLQAHGKFKVYTKQSTMYVEPQSEDCDLDGAWEAMTKLFGVVGLSRARACAKDKDAMLQTAVEYLGDRLAAAKTFKVESKRADKSFPHDLHPALPVRGRRAGREVPQPDRGRAPPGADRLPGGAGLRRLRPRRPGAGSWRPARGRGGPGGEPAFRRHRLPVASWMIAKRGIALEMVHFFSYPYTSEEAKQKVLTLAKLLTPGADGSPSTWCPSPPSRRSCAASARRSCSPCSCGGS